MELHEKYPSAARAELRSDLFLPASLFAVAGVVIGIDSVASHEGLRRVGGVLAAALLLYLARALWALRSWARWALVYGVGALLAAGLFERLILDPFPTGTAWIGIVLGTLFWGGLILYLASPYASHVFRVAHSEWEPRSRRAQAADESVTSPR